VLTSNAHWRCDYCGRFISQSDIDSKKAISSEELNVFGYDPPDAEYVWVNYHARCKEKHEGR